MFLIRVNCKVGMKWTTVEEEEGVNMLLKNVCCLCYMATSQTNTHTFRGRPTPKNEIRSVRNQSLESQGYTSYLSVLV